MVDLLLLEANYSLLNPQSYNVKSEMMDSLYGLIFKKHHADSIAYKNSIEYYSETPNHYIEIMESVKARLSSIDSVAQIKYGKEHEATMPINPLDIQKALRDSIKLAKKKELKERFKNNNHTQ